MNFDWTQMLTATLILFAVVDIVGSIPVILKIKSNNGEIKPLKATFVSLCLMVAFLFVGEELIGLIGIDVNSFAVAGAFVLFFLALEMILGVNIFKQDAQSLKTASIVPIAFPIIAGAGSMTTLVALRSEFEVKYILISIVINMIIVFIVLKLTKRIERLLGKGGIAVLEKVFGIILLAIAVKLFSSNIHELFESLEQSPK